MFRYHRVDNNQPNYDGFYNANLDNYGANKHYHNGINSADNYNADYTSDNDFDGGTGWGFTGRRNCNYCAFCFLVSDDIRYNTASLSFEESERKATIKTNRIKKLLDMERPAT